MKLSIEVDLDSGGTITVNGDFLTTENVAEVFQMFVERPIGGGVVERKVDGMNRRFPMSRQRLEQTATLYERGGAAEVASGLNLSMASAYRMVKAARDAEILAPRKARS